MTLSIEINVKRITINIKMTTSISQVSGLEQEHKYITGLNIIVSAHPSSNLGHCRKIKTIKRTINICWILIYSWVRYRIQISYQIVRMTTTCIYFERNNRFTHTLKCKLLRGINHDMTVLSRDHLIYFYFPPFSWCDHLLYGLSLFLVIIT